MPPSLLPTVFDEIISAPLNPLLEKGMDEGRKVIGYTCSYVPEPLLSVSGLQPIRMRAPGAVGTPLADSYLSSVTCPYTRSLLEFELEGSYHFLDGWVFTASCDHLRRLYDNLEYLAKPSFNYIIDLPHLLGEEALAWFVEELKLLAQALSKHFGVDAGADALKEAISGYNEYLKVLGSIGEMRRLEHPPISGSEFHKIWVACAAAPKDMLLDQLKEFHRTLAGREGIKDFRARLMLLGSQLDDPGYIGVIESVGGLVVADRFCFGSIPGLEMISEKGKPLKALAAHYLRKISCPRMMGEFKQRAEDAIKAATQYRVDGVVIEAMKFCDTWGVDSSLMAKVLREAGIPVLRLEREYALTGEGQLRTRIQAFLESMGK